MNKILSIEQINKTSSQYLQEGRKQESWEIQLVQILENGLQAEIEMVQTFTSNTDGAGFHLTIFSSLEFLSQLMIVYAHDWAGVKSKSSEGWRVDSSIKCSGAIRSTSIKVSMEVLKIKKRGDNLYCHADFRIYSDTDEGFFKATLKGFLS